MEALTAILDETVDPVIETEQLLYAAERYLGPLTLDQWLTARPPPWWDDEDESAMPEEPPEPAEPLESRLPVARPKRTPGICVVHFIGRASSEKERTRVEMAMAEMALTENVWPQHDNDSTPDEQREPPMLRNASGAA